MTIHEWIVTGLGLVMTISSPFAWKRWGVDPIVAIFTFIAGISLVVGGHC